ncbi:MAG: hypothetical protein QOF44_3695 [Streptomyces sp.]|nr:hypothetical protein [Streptomyces sp.]
MSRPVPLSVLDLVPVSSGSTAAQALRNTVDLARRAEEFGYHRYWVAEHHLNPGVAGTSPALVISLVAAATERIRVGRGPYSWGITHRCRWWSSSASWRRCIPGGSTWAVRV